jgi:hypothetical protein
VTELDRAPLFVPLKAEWFDAFANGSKQWEHRMEKRQWNVRQVVVGRRVTLSRGYGAHARLTGTIVEVTRHTARALRDVETVYPDATPDSLFISFRIALDAVSCT